MAISGDKGRTIWAQINARAWQDPDYRKRLLADPKGVLKAEGISFPDGMDVRVLEETSAVKWIVLADGYDIDANAGAILSGWKRLVPIADGHEVRFVQNSSKRHHVILLAHPAGMQAGQLSESELMQVAGGKGHHHGYEDVKTNTTEAVEAETTEAVATQTTEAQDAETTTTAVAEVEVAVVAALIT